MAYAVAVNVLRIEVVTVRTEARADAILEEEPEVPMAAPADVVAAADNPALELLLIPAFDEASDG